MERPIIFSTEMVKAILDGRKTMARRVIKPQPYSNTKFITPPDEWKEYWTFSRIEYDQSAHCVKCPHGQVGDRLWVRETFGEESGDIYFKSDWDKDKPVNMVCEGGKWGSSIFMPRWALRITLEITGVRVERLQEITEEDCLAEGCPKILGDTTGLEVASARYVFEKLWDSLNAKRGYGWVDNPWVWVIKFDNIGVR